MVPYMLYYHFGPKTFYSEFAPIGDKNKKKPVKIALQCVGYHESKDRLKWILIPCFLNMHKILVGSFCQVSRYFKLLLCRKEMTFFSRTSFCSGWMVVSDVTCPWLRFSLFPFHVCQMRVLTQEISSAEDSSLLCSMVFPSCILLICGRSKDTPRWLSLRVPMIIKGISQWPRTLLWPQVFTAYFLNTCLGIWK